MDFYQLVKESSFITTDDFLGLIDKSIRVFREHDNHRENLTKTGKLVTLKPVGEVLVLGDLHGDLASLSTIIEQSAFLKKMEVDKFATLVFLGDYGDRGAQSPELYYVVLMIKMAFPDQVVLLRGNHEGPSDLMASPHDLPVHLRRKFKEKWATVYQRLRELFDCLYTAVYVEDRYIMVHGGLPAKIQSLQEVAEAENMYHVKSFFEELLWNDPSEQIRGVSSSPRGAGNLFGKTITQDVLQKLGVKILIRGHEFAHEGFKINHEGKILTLFSRKGPPYFNKYGAYLNLPLTPNFESANQLLQYIHQF